jgi:hypothetical protein
MGLNGGPFTFSRVISFIINWERRKEVDHFWEKLSEGRKTRTMRLAQRLSMVCHGKSFPLFSVKCCRIKTPGNRKG